MPCACSASCRPTTRLPIVELADAGESRGRERDRGDRRRGSGLSERKLARPPPSQGFGRYVVEASSMSLNVHGVDWHAKTVRAWQLAILRFAVTLDNADRLAVMAIANEIDRLAPQHDAARPDFSFFRRTSAELCAAILQPNELHFTVLRQYLARIDDDRLKRAFAATIEADQPKGSSVSKPFKRDRGLWRGLSSAGNRPL